MVQKYSNKGIKEETGASYKQINLIFAIIRRIIEKTGNEKIGGGFDCYIEIDETAVSKRKFDRGRRVSSLWCVWGGGACIKHKCFFFSTTRPSETNPHPRELSLSMLKQTLE